MLFDRDLQEGPLRRGEVMLYAIINPEDGFTDAPLTPTAAEVQVQSVSKVTDFGTTVATFSQPYSDALSAKYSTSIRAWIAQLPARDYAEADQVLVTARVTIAGTVYPSRRLVAVVGP